MVEESKKLLVRATAYKNQAKKEHELLKEKWIKGTEEELEKTEPLEQVCSALREELDSQNQKRMEALNKKFIPLVVTDEPSRKANYKINAMKILYELHTLKQRRAFINLRAEIEEDRRKKVENEVGKCVCCVMTYKCRYQMMNFTFIATVTLTYHLTHCCQ